jgi:hypothetical protein
MVFCHILSRNNRGFQRLPAEALLNYRNRSFGDDDKTSDST